MQTAVLGKGSQSNKPVRGLERLSQRIGSLADCLPDSELEKLEELLTEFEVKFPKYLYSESEASQQILNHVLDSKGKRLRALLFFVCCKILGYDGKDLFSMAAVAELVHHASLIHDDIIDDSKLRRTKPAVHTIWGSESAVLVGDLMLSISSELMSRTGKMPIVKSYAETIRKMSEGELIQLDHLYSLDITEETYFKILSYKTASLMGTVCQSAGYLAEAQTEQIEALFNFGFYLGSAFQVVDDSLDYRKDTASLGKKASADLVSGKVTLPFIYLRDQLDKEQLQSFEAKLKDSSTHGELFEEVLLKAEEHGTIDKSLEKAAQLTEQALQCLDVFPDQPFKDFLIVFAKDLVLRQV